MLLTQFVRAPPWYWGMQEAGNITNKHSFKFSGLVNDKTVEIEPEDEGRGVTMGIRTRAGRNKVRLRAA